MAAPTGDALSVSSGALLIANGRIFDPALGLDLLGDLAIRDGRIVAAEPALSPWEGCETIDARGALVVPALVDIHAHVFAGQDLGLDPDPLCLPSGVTLVADAGSAGAHLFEAFRRGTIERAQTRIKVFLNLSSIGLTSVFLAGELEDLARCSVDAWCACAERYPELIVGLKIRADAAALGAADAEEVLRRARQAADAAGLPIMVHIGNAQPPLDRILDHLQAGDIVTHSFTGLENRLLDARGQIRPGVWEARSRGVRFDLGHGLGSFDAGVARACLAQGFRPDTVSTDAHAYSAAAVGNLLEVASRMLAIEMPLEELLPAITSTPATVLGAAAELGTLAAGSSGDIAIIALEPGRYEYRDSAGGAYVGTSRLRLQYTVMDGKVIYEEAGETGGIPGG